MHVLESLALVHQMESLESMQHRLASIVHHPWRLGDRARPIVPKSGKVNKISNPTQLSIRLSNVMVLQFMHCLH